VDVEVEDHRQQLVAGVAGHQAAAAPVVRQPDDVRRAAAARLKPDNLVVVVAGDLSKIEAPIRARNLGTVEVWDADGKKIR